MEDKEKANNTQEFNDKEILDVWFSVDIPLI
jgi:hypothetical protein